MAEINTTRCEIERAIFRSHDLTQKVDLSTNFITSFELTQSMGSVAYTGSANILDTTGILESFPLRGEERLDLWFRSYDLDTLVKLNVRVFRINNIQPSLNSNSVTYTIHFVSEATFDASTKSLIEPFTSSISGAVHKVFKNNYRNLPNKAQGDALDPDDKTKVLPFATQRYELKDEQYGRNLFITPTVGVAKFIIPDMTPAEAINFMCSRSYNPGTPSQTFRFFETFNNYYFCPDEYFVKDPKVVHELFYAPVVDLGPQNIEAQFKRVEAINVVSKGIDSAMDLASGSYRNEVVEVDLVRRKFTISKFNFDNTEYYDMSGTKRKSDANPHSESFRQDIFTDENAKRFMVFRNYSSPGDIPSNLSQDKHYADIVQNRVSYYHHLNNTTLTASLKGRLDITPGEIVNLDIKALDSDGKSVVNNSLAGRYLVYATNHSVDEASTLSTTLKLVKFDWDAGDKPEQSQDFIDNAVISGGAG